MDSKYPVNFHCIGCKSSENPEGVDYSDQYLSILEILHFIYGLIKES